MDDTHGATAVQACGLRLNRTPSCNAGVPRRSKALPKHAVRTGLLEGPVSVGEVRASSGTRADCAPATGLTDTRAVVVSFRTAPGGPISDARLGGSWELRKQVPGQLPIGWLLLGSEAPRVARPVTVTFELATGTVGDKTCCDPTRKLCLEDKGCSSCAPRSNGGPTPPAARSEAD